MMYFSFFTTCLENNLNIIYILPTEELSILSEKFLHVIHVEEGSSIIAMTEQSLSSNIYKLTLKSANLTSIAHESALKCQVFADVC